MEKLNTSTATREELIRFLEGCKASPGKELGLRGYVKRVDGKEVVILFNRAEQAKGSNFLEKAIDRFWNWFDRDAQRKLAQEGLKSMLNNLRGNQEVLRNLRLEASKPPSIKPSGLLADLESTQWHALSEKLKSLCRLDRNSLGAEVQHLDWKKAEQDLKRISGSDDPLFTAWSVSAADLKACTQAFIEYAITLPDKEGQRNGDPAAPALVLRFAALWKAVRDYSLDKAPVKLEGNTVKLIDAIVAKLQTRCERVGGDLSSVVNAYCEGFLVKDEKKEKITPAEDFRRALQEQRGKRLSESDCRLMRLMESSYERDIQSSSIKEALVSIPEDYSREFFWFVQCLVPRQEPITAGNDAGPPFDVEKVIGFAEGWKRAVGNMPHGALPPLYGTLINDIVEVVSAFAEDPASESSADAIIPLEPKAEDERDLTSSLRSIDTVLLKSVDFQAWLHFSPNKSRIEECCRHFIEFARAIHEGRNSVYDIGLLQEFADFWKETGQDNPAKIDSKVFAFYRPAVDHLVGRINGFSDDPVAAPGFKQRVRDFFVEGSAGKSDSSPVQAQPEKPVQPNAAPVWSSFSNSDDIEETFSGRHKADPVRKECLDAFHDFGLRFNATREALRKDVELDKALLEEFAVEWKKARKENNIVQIYRLLGPFPECQVDLLVDMVERIPKDKHTKLRNFYRQEAAEYQRKLEEAARRSLYL